MNMTFQGSKDYVASDELMRSVNIAIALQKPLLIKGEPGTGKTMLAEAISQALGKKLIIWNIKSTTKAQDGLYVYDVVQRLYDSQFGNEGVDNIAKYVKLGKLGEAFSSDEQVILLIDEIDKADLEFPNDLLWENFPMKSRCAKSSRYILPRWRNVCSSRCWKPSTGYAGFTISRKNPAPPRLSTGYTRWSWAASRRIKSGKPSRLRAFC